MRRGEDEEGKEVKGWKLTCSGPVWSMLSSGQRVW